MDWVEQGSEEWRSLDPEHLDPEQLKASRSGQLAIHDPVVRAKMAAIMRRALLRACGPSPAPG